MTGQADKVAQAEQLVAGMLDGELSEEEISEALVGMADRGETAEDIAGAVLAMRKRMKRVEAPASAIDVCGTGGDGQHSLNVSTAVAIVVAASGVAVAKHGNRAASSKAGAADTLEALGLDLTAAALHAERTLGELGICFFFAQSYHPALARVAPIRKALGRRTIFNLTGPLANPAGVRRQLVGVASPQLVETYRDAMAMLGSESGLVVSGEEGLDEISVAGPTRLASIGLSGVGSSVDPDMAGVGSHPIEALRGGDAAFNAAALRRLLSGETGAYRDAVLINAAGALLVAGEASDWRDGVDAAAVAIDRGLAAELLGKWIEMAR
ncbi:anthranilate phosphoribosyltransferase [Novosphingobium marinum]|uniref:Anthranilate phosphoribosyltransferase n=1 Tax=Novosphingobium marinum TaxID=1514948 RepID=A0A7Y9XTM0_9SPHN|nr:anthranilate phosphoribosyltransferase [Novosphingobium marinum]NYH94300.1 anthranilate phosphoribosyltransferase [Novosphingobium marinum]GGC21250.1 anthranilate phosphoribosyltransferase [Novosphingobium marinum]